MILYLLQNDIKYFKDDDPVAATILVIALAVILVVVFIANLLRHGLKTGGMGSPRRFSVFALRRAVKPYGLNREQTRMLEYVFKINGVIDPVHTLAAPSVLDKHFKRAYKEIERGAATEEEAQKKLSMLFSVRNVIDVAQNTSTEAPGIKEMTSTEAGLTVNNETYKIKVISKKEGIIQIDCPKNALGSLIKFPKGTRAALSYMVKNKGVSLDCIVDGSQDTTFGPVIQLSGVSAPKAMAKRRFRRRRALLSCGFQLVRVEPSPNKKAPPRMIVTGNHYLGSVVDISVGGCAINANASVPVGSRIKIEFENTRNIKPVAVLGQVLRMNRGGGVSTVLHIKFLKVPGKAMNAINSIVFEYSD